LRNKGDLTGYSEKHKGPAWVGVEALWHKESSGCSS